MAKRLLVLGNAKLNAVTGCYGIGAFTSIAYRYLYVSESFGIAVLISVAPMGRWCPSAQTPALQMPAKMALLCRISCLPGLVFLCT
jgi:hypothetical protein